MADWYTEGLEEMMQDIVDRTGVTREDVDAVYSFLNEIGIVDYDIEKDVIYENYSPE